LEEDEEKKESDNLPQEEEIESPKDNSDFIGSLKLGNIVEGLWSGRWYPGEGDFNRFFIWNTCN